jgi:tRNA threonylcarbamoyladenosine biosynthesis protein TsaB
MKVIALDTTTRAGSAALVVGEHVIEERAGDPSRTHAERLPADIVALAAAHRVRLTEVDLFAVATGPGSFTGLRIGIATIQGLAAVGARRIAGVSAFDALAHAASTTRSPGQMIAAWIDAHRREVFAALYRVGGGAAYSAGRLECLEGPTVGDPAATLARWQQSFNLDRAVLTGNGATLYEEVIRSAIAEAEVGDHPMLAGTIGRLAAADTAAAVGAGELRPLYVRRPDAEIARDKA